MSGILEMSRCCDLKISLGSQVAGDCRNFDVASVESEREDSSRSDSSDVDRFDEGGGYAESGYGSSPKGSAYVLVFG